ncbi:MAG: glycoside hydrolase family 20 zincin-like fold domain-containing protein, partial [Bacteroidota bacterium]
MRFFVLFTFALCCFACGETVPPPPAMPPLSDLPLVPLPFEMANTDGYFYSDGTGEWDLGAAAGAGEYLKAKGVSPLALSTVIDPSLNLPEGSYLLLITPEEITISAGDKAGIFNGTTTLEQVIAFAPDSERGLFLPTGTITDMPRYAYRGY